MKRLITTVILGVGLCQAVLGGPIPIYQNSQLVTNAPVVDAVIFLNEGDFLADMGLALGAIDIPYMTTDTLYYTNTSRGFMEGYPGFRFDRGTGSTRQSASTFFNAGMVEGVDLQGSPYLWAPPGSTTVAVPIAALSQPYASQLLVQATNIFNTGFYPQGMYVGDIGSLTLMGSNVSTAYGTLVAGEVAPSALTVQDTTGLMGLGTVVGANKQSYYVNAPSVHDLFWGATNTQNIRVDALGANFVPTTAITVTNLGGAIVIDQLPLNISPVWSYSVFSNVLNLTNIYYNVVIVNTNFISPALAGSPLSGAVGFAPGTGTNAANQPDGIVQFSEPVFDVITGEMVTNSVYLIDTGSSLGTNGMANNAGVAGAYGRPLALAVTTTTPVEWNGAVQGNGVFDPTVFFLPGQFRSNNPPYVVSEYGAQIGRNPEVLSGSFDTAANLNLNLFLPVVNLPDPTNGPGRIEIDAANLDVTQARLRAEGMVTLNVSNQLTGSDSATADWGQMNATITAGKGSLVISNVFPSDFQRVLGNIYAWEATWQNTLTNTSPGGTDTNATNGLQYYYHVLVVDQSLRGTFQSTVRNLNLTGKKSIVVQDNLNVINEALFNTTNLTINSTVGLSQNAQNFTPTNTPWLQNLFINTNGVFGVENTMDVGLNVAQGVASPAGRQYTVNSITNFGQMASTNGAVLLQSRILENDGGVESEGSMILEADAMGLGLAGLGTTNFFGLTASTLLAFGDVHLSANTIRATNSLIEAAFGSLILEATEQLTDFASGIPTANTNSPIFNEWITTGGFSMPVKPATGDLYGTEIMTYASGLQQVEHVWAGTDMGSNVTSGPLNNAVIGHLVLDRTSNAVLRFKAAGARNAMYVDYLELADDALTNYHTGLNIDPNFTIYFANCNLDPQKLMQVYYPRIVWMTNFVGPNSVKVVQSSNGVCLINAGVAYSTEIAFFPGVANAYNTNVLNDPNNPNIWLPCPASGPRGPVLNLVQITTDGQGKVSSSVPPAKMVLGKSYTLTAMPANGWVFENWAVIGLAGAVNTNSPVLKFTFVTNTMITANFVPNPFGGLKGVYNGLFIESDAVSPANSGAFTLTLLASGSFSGRLLLGPSTYQFSSQFTGDGVAQVQAASGAQKLPVNLQLDLSGISGQIEGDVNGAPLEADIAPGWTTKNPSPLAGAYTMVLPWATGTNTNVVAGDSFGTGTVSKPGVLTLGGTLADGATFSASAPVAQSGRWPFYVFASAGKDSLFGWVTVSNGLSGTNINWFKGPGRGPLYAGGFENALQMTGSAWQAPVAGMPVLTLFNPAVILSGGDLAATLIDPVAPVNGLSYGAPNVSLSIKAATGSFSGWFEAPGSARKQPISGVVLENANMAQGLFLGADQSGEVLLEGQ